VAVTKCDRKNMLSSMRFPYRKGFHGSSGSNRAAAVGRSRRGKAILLMRTRPLNIARRGLQLSNGEFKAKDTNLDYNFNTTGTLVLLNGIARGDEISERNGREIMMKSIQITMKSAATAGTGLPQAMRALVVYDKQANAAAPTVAQILEGGLDSRVTTRMRNLENRKRFVILMDEVFTVGPLGVNVGALGADPNHVLKWYKKVHLPVEFNSGDAGTVADITTGSLYLVTVGDKDSGETDGFGYGMCRIRYTDN